MLAPGADPARVGVVQRRALAVSLGAATALVACLVSPVPGAGMALLVTMPLWRRWLDRRAARLSA